MKQIFLYGLFLFLLMYIHPSGNVYALQEIGCEEEGVGSEKFHSAKDCYSSFDHLFDNDCGELALDLNHFTSDIKFYVRIQVHHGENRKAFFRACMSDGCISYFSLPAVNSYYIYGLHKIIV